MTETKFATIGAVYDDGVTLIFDGEAAPTAKHYRCNTSVIFTSGDRVKICPDSGTYVVEYVVGAPARPPADVTVDRLVRGAYSAELTDAALCYGSNATRMHTLGTGAYPWAGLFTGDGKTQIATGKGSIGFFGATPIGRQSLSTTSVNQGYTAATASNYLTILNNIAGILKKMGLLA